MMILNPIELVSFIIFIMIISVICVECVLRFDTTRSSQIITGNTLEELENVFRIINPDGTMITINLKRCEKDNCGGKITNSRKSLRNQIIKKMRANITCDTCGEYVTEIWGVL